MEHRGPGATPGNYGYSRGCRCAGCVEAGRVYHAAYALRTRDKKRENDRKRAYGMDPGEYESMLERQDGGCAICGNDSSAGTNSGRRNLCVDHDHDTGEIRGLLCNNCNRAIGLLKDNRALLLRAADYLTTKELA
jgi:hypothetical protein